MWGESLMVTTIITNIFTNISFKVGRGEVVWSRRGFGVQQLLTHGVIRLIEDSRLHHSLEIVSRKGWQNPSYNILRASVP